MRLLAGRSAARGPVFATALALGIALVGAAVSACAPLARQVPGPVQQALADAGLTPDDLTGWVAEAGSNTPLWAHRADVPVPPASLMKLVTSSAALEQLGPGHTWVTRLQHGGGAVDGRLPGPVYLRGGGDPALVIERLWELLARLRASGVQQIDGDLVLDRSAFAPEAEDPGRFDGEPLRPYNVQPDALLINFRSISLQFLPDPAAGVARVVAQPARAGVAVPAQVPLQPGPCGAWRDGLAADFSDPRQIQLRGAYPAACGVMSWSFADPDPDGYEARVIAALWASLGGRLEGVVRDGLTPDGLPVTLESRSAPLAAVLRDINKFSNNPMAEQLFLTLGLVRDGQGTPAAARAAVQQHLARWPACAAPGTVLHNGSGRSREIRLSAHCLADVLQQAWRSPWMPELLASLPVAGQDTARGAQQAAGQAHLKTGTLRDVAALAGVWHGPQGQRRIVVLMLHGPSAATPAARRALDALLGWSAALPPG